MANSMTDYSYSLNDPQGKSWRLSMRAKKKGSFEVKFVQLFPDTTIELASDPEVTGAAFRVYFWAQKELSHRKWMPVDQTTIANDLHISRPSASAALRILSKKGFLERKGSQVRTMWRITPKGSWFGTAGAYQAELRKREATQKGLEVIANDDFEQPDWEG